MASYRKRYSRKRRRSDKKSRSRSKSATKHRKRSCGIGYVRNKLTGRCVYATGNKGRKLNMKRAAVKKAHKRDARPSPNISANLFSVGHVAKGHDGNLWKIKRTSKGIKRWVRA